MEVQERATEGDLRVWWVPQVPMQPFTFRVRTIEQGAMLTDALAKYDLFQFENNIKPDYANVGGLEMFEDGEWVSWECEGYDDPTEYLNYLAESGMLEL